MWRLGLGRRSMSFGEFCVLMACDAAALLLVPGGDVARLRRKQHGLVSAFFSCGSRKRWLAEGYKAGQESTMQEPFFMQTFKQSMLAARPPVANQ